MANTLKRFTKDLEAHGFQTKVTSKGHLSVYLDGKFVTAFGKGPGDWRSDRNAHAALKRAGYTGPPLKR